MIHKAISEARKKSKLSLREAVAKSKEFDEEGKGLALSTLARLEQKECAKPIHPRTARILSQLYGIEYEKLYS